MSRKVLINASNLHVGGGVQVAASFISDLYYLKRFDVSVVCSEAVFNNIPDNVDIKSFTQFDILDVRGVELFYAKETLLSGYDICFTVFGPFYKKIDCKLHLCGFAQPWIIYPNTGAYNLLSPIEKVKTKLKFSIQKYFFNKYDSLVVEHEHVKSSLQKLGFVPDKVEVVHNCVSSVFDSRSCWQDIQVERFSAINDEKRITVGFIGRPYPHKNVKILKVVSDILSSKYDFQCDFVFTFSEVEMTMLDFDNIKNFYSVGPITISQCPNFYLGVDAIVFPSLLECFSATLVESMKMKTPIIASNFPFVTEVCKDAAIYFDPYSAEDIAEKLYLILTNKELRDFCVREGERISESIPTSLGRTNNYLNLIDNMEL